MKKSVAMFFSAFILQEKLYIHAGFMFCIFSRKYIQTGTIIAYFMYTQFQMFHLTDKYIINNLILFSIIFVFFFFANRFSLDIAHQFYYLLHQPIVVFMKVSFTN